ncbi:MAG: tRNA glutamyl-Q(34) synthetase GluQRS, partial [Polyangiaceae bacterium]
MNQRLIVTRFAPSPTGDLHLGGAFVALGSWWLARKHGGSFVARMEDIDTPRVVPGSAERILEDLHWLGLDWDGDVVVQSTRTASYEAALATLTAKGLVYPCDCSRAELARVASAPHANEEIVYPGLCAALHPHREMKRDPALRVRVPRDPAAAVVSFDDQIRGIYTQDLAEKVGDFVIRRADGVFAYQLVVIVDDVAQGVTDVVRGADLLSSTPRQIYLAHALGLEAPRYLHLPLVVDQGGERIAKRTPKAHLRVLRERGFTKEQILGRL